MVNWVSISWGGHWSMFNLTRTEAYDMCELLGGHLAQVVWWIILSCIISIPFLSVFLCISIFLFSSHKDWRPCWELLLARLRTPNGIFTRVLIWYSIFKIHFFHKSSYIWYSILKILGPGHGEMGWWQILAQQQWQRIGGYLGCSLMSSLVSSRHLIANWPVRPW